MQSQSTRPKLNDGSTWHSWYTPPSCRCSLGRARTSCLRRSSPPSSAPSSTPPSSPSTSSPGSSTFPASRRKRRTSSPRGNRWRLRSRGLRSSTAGTCCGLSNIQLTRRYPLYPGCKRYQITHRCPGWKIYQFWLAIKTYNWKFHWQANCLVARNCERLGLKG